MQHEELKQAINEGLQVYGEELKGLQAKAHDLGETLAEHVKNDALSREQFEKINARLQELDARTSAPATAIDDQPEAKADALWGSFFKTQEQNTPDARKAAREAFWKFARRGKEDLAYEEAKLLSTQDSTNGGYLVIPEFATEVIKELANVSPIRSVARVRTTASNSWSIPKRTGRATGGWVGEGDAATESNSTYGREEVPNGALWAYSRATNEELADAGFNLEEQLRMDFTEEFGYREGAAFVSGNGVGKPEGLWTNADVLSVNGGSASAITYAGLVYVSHGDTTNGDVNPQYQRNGRFLMSSSTLGEVRLLEDTAGQLIWQPSGAAGNPSTILGFPYLVVPDAPAIAANAYPVMFGDIRAAYTILDRVSFEMLRNPYAEDKNGIVRFVAYRRVGGQVVQPAAIRKLKIAS